MANSDIEDTLVGTQFCVMNDRSWRSLDLASAKDVHYGILHVIDYNPYLVEALKQRVNLSDIAAINKGMKYLGECERIQELYFEFVTNTRLLLTSFDFSEEGKAALVFLGNIPSSSAANIMFKNIVLSGRRLIDGMEGSIKHTFGDKSEQYQEWREYAERFYDENLAYSFCYDVRNCVEHDGVLFVSAVNIDIEQQTVGFAVNLENELFDTSLKRATKEKLSQFLYERKMNGRSPWLSLSGITKNIHVQIGVLYVCFLRAMTEAAISICETAEQESEELAPINCIVRKMSPLHPNDDSPAARVYKLGPSVPIAHYQMVQEEILKDNEQMMESF